jgi:hypothetical protein
MHRAGGRAGSCPSPARGTVRYWCDSQTGGDTSPQRFCPTASVGSLSGLRSQPPALRGGPSRSRPAPQPWRRAAPDGGRARGAPVLCDNDAWSGFGVFLCASVGWRHRKLLCTVWIVWERGEGHHASSRCERGCLGVMHPSFLLSFAGSLQYI